MDQICLFLLSAMKGERCFECAVKVSCGFFVDTIFRVMFGFDMMSVWNSLRWFCPILDVTSEQKPRV